MPIRFRCAYCNQLMGIARRKAGTVVRCPKCAGELIVPTPPDLPPGEVDNDPQQLSELLESEEFEDHFGPTAVAQGATSTVPPPPKVAPSPAVEPAVSRPGVFVPRWVVVMALVLGLLVLGTLFLAGFLLGRWTADAAAQHAVPTLPLA